MKNNKAFTISELIVVIIIIVILAGIGFFGFKDYPKKARDTVRINDLTKLQKALINYEAINGNYPKPDNFSTSSTMNGWLEGYFGIGVREEIGNMDIFKDPKTKDFYKYMTNSGSSKFRLEADLELKGIYVVEDISEKDGTNYVINPGKVGN